MPHAPILARGQAEILRPLRPDGIVVDVKAALNPDEVPGRLQYWSL